MLTCCCASAQKRWQTQSGTAVPCGHDTGMQDMHVTLAFLMALATLFGGSPVGSPSMKQHHNQGHNRLNLKVYKH